MPNVEAWRDKPLPFSVTIALWAVAAAWLGMMLALTGVAGLFLLGTPALLILFAAFAARFPTFLMGASIVLLGLFPFSWGWQSDVVPKLFGDETLLLLYLAVFPFLYLTGKRSWQPGFRRFYLVLAVFLCLQALSFAVGNDLIALRNFFETYVLGALLLVLFLQEASNSDARVLGKVVVGVTVAIAALSIMERIFLRNPVMENEAKYISPELARVAEGVYRPYATFFYPSEAGSFMGLGVPFAVSSWLKRRSLLSTLWLLILAGGIIVHATRGAWLGLLVAGVLALWSSRLLLAALISTSALGGWIGYFLLKDTAFMQRVMDPQDLLIRFEMWKVAAKVFITHPFLGVGHMQFAQVYLDFVHEVSDIAHFDFGEIIVADNLFLTTAAEHGLLGLVALVAFLLCAALLLRRFRQLLERSGLVEQAGFVRCCALALVIYVVSGCLADVHLFTKLTKLLFILIGLGLGVGVRSLPGGRNPALLPDETFSQEHSGQR